ncbi:hypothetical protein PPERSA_09372 [Pseudocohnilembus persalinus]|uniref:Uncharacterized protein n=1 Tax=Pseudocohnilembus persalinus TaxID=266149 RepID=A0A0V0QLB2_PSEPJ|nr:hypothetical protein PPERSA_09372 [Pseudocohnilembus persalinus]|eukprot:KRX02954.1 hypothetical protein PPERSA_09372 [Pseudocohnilembus persalinus]
MNPQYCPNHFDREISWICLEKKCDQRAVCNLCAVKFHNRDHKVEEYNNIKEQGFINLFFKSEENYKKQFIEDDVISEVLINLQKSQQEAPIQTKKSTSAFIDLNNSKNLTGQLIQSQLNIDMSQFNQLSESREQTTDFEIVNESQENEQQQLQQKQENFSDKNENFQNDVKQETEKDGQEQEEQKQKQEVQDCEENTEQQNQNQKQNQDTEKEEEDSQQNRNYEAEEEKDIEIKVKTKKIINQQLDSQQSQKLKESMKNEINQEIEQQCQYMTKTFENNIRSILQSFYSMDFNIQNQQIDTIQVAKKQKESGLQKLKEIQQELTLMKNGEQLQEKIDEALKIINEDIQTKAEVPVLQALLKKQKILKNLQSNFSQIIKAYLENQFTNQLCELFEVQIQTVSKDNSSILQNQGKFLDHLSNQWAQEQSQLQNQIQIHSDLLNKILKSILEQKPIPQYTMNTTSSPIYQQQPQQFYSQAPQTPLIINHRKAVNKIQQQQQPQQQIQQKGLTQRNLQQQQYIQYINNGQQQQQQYQTSNNNNNSGKKLVILSKPAQNINKRQPSPIQAQDLTGSFEKNATPSPIHYYLQNNNKKNNVTTTKYSNNY